MKSLLAFSFTALTFSFNSFGDLNPKVLSQKFLKVDRYSKEASGFYYGLREANSQRKIKATECQFTYEKGVDNHPKDEKDFAFERFIISFSGVDEKGETSFDSVIYGISDYVGKYQGLNFQRGFPFISMRRVELENPGPTSKMRAERTASGGLNMFFKHREVYSTKNSSFFTPGEEREYDVKVYFEKFDKSVIKLSKVEVQADRLFKKKRKNIVSVTCRAFKDTEDL